MMLVYGVPDSLGGADTDNTIDWNECIQQCYNSQTCVMAWQVKNTCANYDYYSMGSVIQTDSTNGSIVAFKVDNVDNKCPNGTNPPTFNNHNATGLLYVDYDTNDFPLWLYYTISLTGNTWSISYTVNSSCPTGFIEIVIRSDGSAICVYAYFDSDDTTTGFTYASSVTNCNDSPAKAELTGVWYPEDAAYFPKLAQQLRPQIYESSQTNNTYIRIDGIRTAECQATPNTSKCMDVTGFTFTGTPVENFNNYDWVTDSSAQATSDDNCIVMVLNGSDPLKMDVRNCGSSRSPLPAKMIFCSCPAWNF